MKKLLAASLALSFLAGPAHGMGSKASTNTGDRALDSTLEEIGIQANGDPAGFLTQLSSTLNIPEAEIRQAQVTHGLTAADIFMATALASATRQPVLTVAEDYKKNPGRGWGVIARNLGIKPGSRQFHELKQGAQGFRDDMNAMARNREREAKQEREQKVKSESRGRGHGGS